MVNKAALGLLGVVIIASLGVGVLIGMQLGGGDSAEQSPTDSSSDGGGQETAAPTTTGANGTNVSTETGTGNETENVTRNETETKTVTETTEVTTSAPPTTIPARRFSRGDIEKAILEEVNRERQSQGRVKFSGSSPTASTVKTMARNHSVAMANAGKVAHTINNQSIRHRYEEYGLGDRCTFRDSGGGFVWVPSDDKFDDGFEVIGKTVVGRPYEGSNGTKFNEDAEDVATVVVSRWMSNAGDSEVLMRKGPTLLGVGVEVTGDGTVYVTANVCA